MLRGWRRVAALVVGAIIVAAGTWWVVAAATDAGPPGPPAQRLLGELSTIDPCGLTDLGVLAPFGTATLETPVSFEKCIVNIKSSSGASTLLWVGDLDHRESHPNIDDRPARDLPDGLTLVDSEQGSNYCGQLLVFGDAVTLSVRAQVAFGDEPKVCDIVTAAMDKAVQVIRRGGVTHRTYPSGSLATIDPCTVTPADAAAAVPQLREVRPESPPSKHVCTWSTPDDRTRVRVYFSLASRTRPSAPGVDRTIAGRESVVVRAPTRCTARTVHIPFGHADLVEIATVDVDIPEAQSPEVKCEAAVAIATEVWPKLPKAGE